MRSVLKLSRYVALLTTCYWCGFSAYRDYALLMMEDGDGLAHRARAKSVKSTNAAPATAEAEPPPATKAARTNAVHETDVLGEEGGETTAVRVNRRVGRNYLGMLGYTIGFAGALVVLGFVAAQDFGHLLKFRLGKEVSYVDARSERNSNYERAEQIALKGQPREAIRALEAIVAKHPNHIHSILRIAELYDKELHDFQNAALHYEELLRQKIPSEQWGWIAIRLANLYSGKLNQPETAIALISRLAAEHPETQAGAKALKRMGMIAKAGLDVDAGKDL